MSNVKFDYEFRKQYNETYSYLLSRQQRILLEFACLYYNSAHGKRMYKKLHKSGAIPSMEHLIRARRRAIVRRTNVVRAVRIIGMTDCIGTTKWHLQFSRNADRNLISIADEVGSKHITTTSFDLSREGKDTGAHESLSKEPSAVRVYPRRR
jgi:hypothetical protein